MPGRTIVYIDGFNLYYGALRGGPSRWLDLERYFRMLRRDDTLVAIRYFTALVGEPQASRQRAYLQALATTPLVDVVLGRFKTTNTTCRVPGCTYPGPRRFTKPEEKRTDVSIAVEMMDDAFSDRCDIFVLVSGDSDLVPPVHRIKALFPAKQVVVYVPTRDRTRGAAVELRGAADKSRDLPLAMMRHALFPARVVGGPSGGILKPEGW